MILNTKSRCVHAGPECDRLAASSLTLPRFATVSEQPSDAWRCSHCLGTWRVAR